MGAPQPAPFFTLSPSKAAAFEACRKRYWFRYVQRAPDPQVYERHPAALVGIAVHKGMHALGDTGRMDRMEESYAAYLSTPEHAVAGPGTQAFADGLAVLQNGARAHQELVAAGGAHYYEREGSAESGQIRFWAKADRVIVSPGGDVTVVDWKTGGSGFWGPSDDFQAMALHVVTRAGFTLGPEAKVRVLLWNLRSGQKDERVETRAHAVAAVKTLRAEARRMMQTREFPASPGPLCRWCPYLTACPEATALRAPPESTNAAEWLEAAD